MKYIRVKWDVDDTELKKSGEELEKVKKEVGLTDDEVKKVNKSFTETNKTVSNTGGLIKSIGGLIAGLGLAALAMEAAKAWIELNKELSKARKETAQLTKETGAALDRIVSKIQATAKTFGKEYVEVLRAANSLSKEFGISMTKSVDNINQAFMRGANINDELIDSIREYSSQMKAAGLSTEQFVELLVVAGQEGIFSDKGLDVVKEGMLRIREMTTGTNDALKLIGISGAEMQEQLKAGNITIFEAIQQVATGLDKVSESGSETGTVLADVFGGAGEDAGIRFVKRLRELDGIFGELNQEQDKYIERQTKKIQQEEEWANIIMANNKEFEAGASALDQLWGSIRNNFMKLFILSSEQRLYLRTIEDFNKKTLPELTMALDQATKKEEEFWAKIPENQRDSVRSVYQAQILALKELIELKEREIAVNLKSLTTQGGGGGGGKGGTEGVDDRGQFMWFMDSGKFNDAIFMYESFLEAQVDTEHKAFEERKKQDLAYAISKEHLMDINAAIQEKYHQDRMRQLEEERIAEDRIVATREAFVEIAIGAIDTVFAAENNYYRAKLMNEKLTERERKNIMIKMAENEKQMAIFNILINTAQAVVKALAINPVLVPFVIALGGAQLAVAASQPIPRFSKGVLKLNGPGTETSDSVHAMLSRGESVMTAKETKDFLPTLKAIREKKINPDLLNHISKEGRAVIINDNQEVVKELKRLPRTEVNIDENGFIIRQYNIFGAKQRQLKRFLG